MVVPTVKQQIDFINKNFVDGIRQKYPDFDVNSQQVNVFNGWSVAFAPAFVAMYDFFVEIARQSTPVDADSYKDNASLGTLESWGSIFLGRFPFVAGRGRYLVEVDGNGEVAIGTVLLNQSTQKIATVDNLYTINGKTNIEVTSEEVGEAGRLFVGDELVFTQLIEGVNEVAQVKNEIIAPTDGEDIEEYRRKVLQSALIKPRGGSIGDVVLYGLEVDGVANIYPYNGDLLGSAKVYIEADASVSPDGLPPQSLIADVKASIESQGNFQAPRIEFLPIVRRAYNVVITGLSDLTKQNLCETLIKEYFSLRRPVIDGVTKSSEVNKNLILQTSIFSEVFNGINPAILLGLDLKVENYTDKGYLQTKNLSSVSGLYGSTAPADGAFIVKKDGVDHLVTVDGRAYSDLHDYALFLGQKCSVFGVRVDLLIVGNDYFLKFSSETTGSGSTIQLLPPSTGTDLTGATYLDIANQDTQAVAGGTTSIVDIDSERLPEGNIPYLKDLTFV